MYTESRPFIANTESNLVNGQNQFRIVAYVEPLASLVR
jgi:hypothetical protein